MEQKVTLKQDLGLISGLALVVGTVIGSGVFFKQASVLQTTGNQTLGLLAWTLGGVITLAAGLTVAEIGSRIPDAGSGGFYSYIEKIYGHFWGFMTGWSQVIVYAPAVIASIGGYAAHLTANFLGIDMVWARYIGIFYIIFIAGLNLLENRIAAVFAVTTTIIKMIPIVGLMIYGIFFGHANALGQTMTQVTSTTSGSFGMAILATLFAYDGWVLVANIRGEMRRPKRDLPLSIILGVTLVLVAYVGVTFGVYRTLPSATIISLKDNAVFAIIQSAFGTFGGRLLSVIIIISMLGTMNGKMVAFPRMAYMMAQNGLFPKYLARLNRRTFVPSNATLSLSGLTILLTLFTNSADRISDMAMFTIWLFYVAAFIGLFVLRYRQRDQERQIDFKVPLFPVTPLIGVFGGLFVVVSTIQSDFSGTIVSILMVAVGIPVYYYFTHHNQ
ncbi:amino acid permease [Weissella diestrammenae]|uniref:Amino acid permease n=1 Tax=Weissella diestrammenae TaxID=1162633 RepID=A0A7G9T6W9_9LACO|nr:amino acid permease [Weissella diestrammenae]MCM0582561.1 amino acid permease [Weissella diestrammenae]QNN75844.1 amino acid permease [Weissella diestrammenae]